MTDREQKKSQLQDDFLSFRKDAKWCRVVFNNHQALFDTDEATSKLLRQSAWWFFDDINRMSQEYHIVLVGRITDRAKTGEHENLTVDGLVESLRSLELLDDKIEEHASAVNVYRNKIEHSRNKLVVHRDTDSIRTENGGGDHLMADVQAFHDNLSAFCDVVGTAIGVGPLDFSHAPGEGDVLDLLSLLKKHQQIKQELGCA